MRYLTTQVPEDYKCNICEGSGIKLWRDYRSFSVSGSLLCAACGLKEENIEGPVNSEGKVQAKDDPLYTDQIGYLVPAIPDEKGTGYWGYTSVPQAGVLWWRNLPNEISKEQAVKAHVKWCFDLEPEIHAIYWAQPEEDVIKLLIVNPSIPPATNENKFWVIGTKPSPGTQWPIRISEVTPEEFETLKDFPGRLPDGWDLKTAKVFKKDPEDPEDPEDVQICPETKEACIYSCPYVCRYEE